mgnify:CR=1 FL=1
MSIEKNHYKNDDSSLDEQFMARCLELAAKGKGRVTPNPLVGCVIVHKGIIVAEGFHETFGENHAEVNAIAKLKGKFKTKEEDESIIPFCTLYVNLEPCSHHGKTPPCSNLIISSGFKKVVIGSIDSNSEVDGSGMKQLKQAGVNVSIGILEKENKTLNKAFFTFHELKRPYYILKWAESTNGFIYSESNSPKISNDLSSQKVHEMRNVAHAILIGKNTLIEDDPLLNVRHVVGVDPIKIIVVNRIPEEILKSKLVKSNANVLIFNTEKNEVNGQIEFIKYETKTLIKTLNTALHQKNIQSVLVEGGTKILSQFIESNTWDEIHQITGNKVFKSGIKAPSTSKITLRNKHSVGADEWKTYYK